MHQLQTAMLKATLVDTIDRAQDSFGLSLDKKHIDHIADACISVLVRHKLADDSMDKMLMLHKAEQQIYGYCHSGQSIGELVKAMGLTNEEWAELNRHFAMGYLSAQQWEEIQEAIK